MGQDMKFRAIAILVSLILFLFASYLQAASLMEVYEQAIQNDPTFQQAEATWLSERENLPIARADYLTSIDVQGTLNRNWLLAEPVQSTVNANGFFNSYSYSLTANQPIFNVAAWQAIKGAKATVKASTATYIAAAQSLMARTTTAYLSVLQAYDQLRYTISNKNAVWRQLLTAREQFKVGLIAITGVYDAQSVYDQATATEIADRNTLSNRIEDLRAITGYHYLQLNGLGREVPLLKPNPDNINVWVNIAERQNYELLAEDFKVIAARENIKQLAAENYPTLDLVGTYSRQRSWNHQNITTDLDTQNAAIGLSLDFPVIQGGAVIAQTSQARYDYLAASAQREFTHRDVVNKTRQAYLGVISGISQIKADKQTITSARNALEATQAGYAVGTRTMVDVLNDLSTLYQAQQKYADDQYTYILNIIDLKQAAGTLNEKDLEEINQWLNKRIKFPVPKALYPINTVPQETLMQHQVTTHKKFQKKQAMQWSKKKKMVIRDNSSEQLIIVHLPAPKMTTHL